MGKASGVVEEIVCQQVLMEDSSVYSSQWMTVPASIAVRLSPQYLLEQYLLYIRRWTRGIIRPLRLDGRTEFRIAGTSLSLVSFKGPHFEGADGRGIALLDICGGLLVQSGGGNRGMLSIIVEPEQDGKRITLLLADYIPLLLGSRRPSSLRKLLYRFTQAFIHRLVTVDFLVACYSELAGPDACFRVVRRRVDQHNLDDVEDI